MAACSSKCQEEIPRRAHHGGLSSRDETLPAHAENEHIQNIFEEGELTQESVVRKFRITASDGKIYEIQHYNLDAIISVGYRGRSHRGTQIRIWATQRLREFIVKGFTMGDERLKNPPGPGQKDYLDE